MIRQRKFLVNQFKVLVHNSSNPEVTKAKHQNVSWLSVQKQGTPLITCKSNLGSLQQRQLPDSHSYIRVLQEQIRCFPGSYKADEGVMGLKERAKAANFNQSDQCVPSKGKSNSSVLTKSPFAVLKFVFKYVIYVFNKSSDGSHQAKQ